MKNLIVILMCVGLTGCASLWDAPKNIWGNSQRELEEARKSSLYQYYDQSKEEVFYQILNFADEMKYHVFSQDEERGVIVLMDIPGAVNTTEVGVFIVPDLSSSDVKVELSSRSTPAKKAVAKHLFLYLSESFAEAK